MSKTHKRGRRAQFVYEGFGFPAVLVDVPVIRVRGAWTPDVDLNGLARDLLQALARVRARLTGNQVRFIRHSFKMTLERFAGRFGVTHPAVIKWERAGNSPTPMSWAIEKDIRLEIIRSLSPVRPAQFVQLYGALANRPAGRFERVRLRIGA